MSVCVLGRMLNGAVLFWCMDKCVCLMYVVMVRWVDCCDVWCAFSSPFEGPSFVACLLGGHPFFDRWLLTA